MKLFSYYLCRKQSFDPMITIKRHIPNFVTSLGLLSGCISIVYSTSGNLRLAGIFILIAALFDFFDGWTARMLNSISEFGIQLDSLADVISFGVAPSFIMYKLMLFSLVESSPASDFNIVEPGLAQTLVLSSSFLIAVFSALRLARFNTDATQAESFRGLPTPAAALLIAGIGFVVADDKRNLPLEPVFLKTWFLIILILLVCWLMVSGIRMFSLKFKHYGIKENALRYLFLVISVILIILFRLPGIVPVIVLYILLSLIVPLISRKNH
jgi:CDP-diacylglycerol--serine O-phosphatidyltransferase